MTTLNIVGGGKVGSTLGRLWTDAGAFELKGVVNRSLESASRAVSFIGAGRALRNLQQLEPADVLMLSVSDAQIAPVTDALSASAPVLAGSVVVHCSGALPSTVLAPLEALGASTASAHPIKSFAKSSHSVSSFTGTWCTLEGDTEALARLQPAFELIGAKVLRIATDQKLIYHAASVFSCNYLVALLEVGVRAFVKSGLSRATALAAMEPLVRSTLDNVFALDTAEALTGPIARGDHDLVAQQYEALGAWNEGAAELYRHLGRVAVEIARTRGGADRADLESLEDLFD